MLLIGAFIENNALLGLHPIRGEFFEPDGYSAKYPLQDDAWPSTNDHACSATYSCLHRATHRPMLDRITDRAHIIETGTDSFRFKRTLAQRQRKGSEHDEHPVT